MTEVNPVAGMILSAGQWANKKIKKGNATVQDVHNTLMKHRANLELAAQLHDQAPAGGDVHITLPSGVKMKYTKGGAAPAAPTATTTTKGGGKGKTTTTKGKTTGKGPTGTVAKVATTVGKAVKKEAVKTVRTAAKKGTGAKVGEAGGAAIAGAAAGYLTENPRVVAKAAEIGGKVGKKVGAAADAKVIAKTSKKPAAETRVGTSRAGTPIKRKK